MCLACGEPGGDGAKRGLELLAQIWLGRVDCFGFLEQYPGFPAITQLDQAIREGDLRVGEFGAALRVVQR